ncbi:MAG: hypothetical protein WDN24_12190 [Sphingomonas sp.]
MALIGPNCLGYNSKVEGIAVGFGLGGMAAAERVAAPAIALVAQSGGMIAKRRAGAGRAQHPDLAFDIDRNEAMLGIEDFLAEHRPRRGLGRRHRLRRTGAAARTLPAAVRACKGARQDGGHAASGQVAARAGRPIRTAARWRGDHLAMQVLATHAGAIFVDTMEELVDVAELMARYGRAPTRGRRRG